MGIEDKVLQRMERVSEGLFYYDRFGELYSAAEYRRRLRDDAAFALAECAGELASVTPRRIAAVYGLGWGLIAGLLAQTASDDPLMGMGAAAIGSLAGYAYEWKGLKRGSTPLSSSS